MMESLLKAVIISSIKEMKEGRVLQQIEDDTLLRRASRIHHPWGSFERADREEDYWSPGVFWESELTVH